LVTGGAGYVGSVLVPKLLEKEYRVTVFDNLIFGTTGLDKTIDSHLIIVEGDIRDKKALEWVMKDQDAVIHLAAISNDPCSELDHELTKKVNISGEIKDIDTNKKAILFIDNTTVIFDMDDEKYILIKTNYIGKNVVISYQEIKEINECDGNGWFMFKYEYDDKLISIEEVQQ